MSVQTIPTRNYQVGTNNLGPVSIASGVANIRLSLSRVDWTDPSVKLDVRFDISLDGGVTWSPDPTGEVSWPYGQFPVKFTAAGGVLTGPGNVTITESSVNMPLPDNGNANRRIRGVATVTGGSLRTAITIETT